MSLKSQKFILQIKFLLQILYISGILYGNFSFYPMQIKLRNILML